MRPNDLADEASVDRLIAEYLSARDRGAAPAPADWVAAHPVHAADLTAYLANERALGTRLDPLLDPDTLAGPVRSGQVFGQYVLVRRLAIGGMAAVWEAEQQGLRRRVAVKVLTAAGSAESAARFHREAEAVAALNHPHIVPIYEVGEAGGMPFFAMKLAASDLRHRLDRYTADPRAAAALLAKVARAVHHAHQHGVLHRDLKPANVLLDETAAGAEPLVADFGLAKHTSAGGPPDPTRTGAVIGTPGYMSPEQADGRGNRGTVRTDVWGLGAVLYALLTGCPPFAGDGEYDTLRKVLTADPTRPRAVAPTADPDLETVCLKCLEKDPASRYPSAEAVADELERWLRGETIVARPVGPLTRGGRWVRRNPYPATVMATAGLLMVTVAVAAGVTARLNARLASQNGELDQANSRLTAALAEAQAARDLEARNSALAREAIAGYDRVGNSPELRAPGLQAARQRMYTEALCYYQRFAEQNGPDGPLARESLDARLKTARMCLLLDRGAEALEHLKFVIERGQSLLRSDPGDRPARHLLADAWGVRGDALSRVKGQQAAAVEAWRECDRVGRSIADADPATAAVLSDAAQNVGRTVFVRDATAGREAFAAARRYAELVARAEAASPAGGPHRGQSALLAVQLAEAQSESDAGYLTRAIQLYRPITDEWARAPTSEGGCTRNETDSDRARPPVAPPRPDQIVQVATALRGLGEALHQSHQGDPVDAFEEAINAFQRLSRDNPDVQQYAFEEGVCRTGLGMVLMDKGELPRAVAMFTEAIRRMTRTADGKQTFAPDYRVIGVRAFLGRGRANARQGRLAEADDDFQKAASWDGGANAVTIAMYRLEALCLRGDHATAARKLQTLPIPPHQSPDQSWVEHAIGWARCAMAVDRDRTLSDAERQRLLAEYRAKAKAAVGNVRDRDNERIRVLLAQPGVRRYVE